MKEHITLDRLTGLTAFVRSASLGSYTAAARALSLSPSAVSKSVRRLEQELAVWLFTRTTRSLTLTPEGQDVYHHGLRILREVEAMQQAVLAARTELSGQIRITAPLSVGTHMLAPILPLFRERHPGISIDLRLEDRLLDLVEEGIDVAIRSGTLADSRLRSRSLFPHRLCAFAAPGYLARHGAPTHPEDVLHHSCVNFRYRNSGQIAPWPFRLADDLVELTPKAAFTVDTVDTLVALTAAGAGICVSVSSFAQSHVARGELVPILDEYAVDFPVALLWPESRSGNPAVRALLEFLRQTMTGTQGGITA
ncbi:LysR family transcriptional regulator [Novosphingobium sp. KN65.2]|uniref:LysR family transcriptional regulator n=1 Tax=Novosphingobium sp. KN65.2 TaxID=1478134 RepID=UPI0005DCA039|nr:LysR family transcriptional regulator [Novosphingobium sp. KN65.2]CDO35238.1 Transcriptional regulator, LysR family [Novosphingobium sp. KN65.2]